MTLPRGKPRASQTGISRARELRRDATVPEQKLWARLRNRRLGGLKFKRQAAMGPYFVDFYCAERLLVVELDGLSHVGAAEADARRTEHLQQVFKVRVIRFTNDEVLEHEDAVAVAIARAAGLDW